MFLTYRRPYQGLRKQYRLMPRLRLFRNKRRRYRKRRYRKRIGLNVNKTFKKRSIRKRSIRKIANKNIAMTFNSFKQRNFTNKSCNNCCYTGECGYLKYRLSCLIKSGAPAASINKARGLYNACINPISDKTPIDGVVEDGYIKEASGSLYAVGNSETEIAQCTSDDNGNYEISIESDQLPDVFQIKFTGGTDISTNKTKDTTEYISTSTKNNVIKGETTINITPITSLVSAMIPNNTNVTANDLDVATETVTSLFESIISLVFL